MGDLKRSSQGQPARAGIAAAPKSRAARKVETRKRLVAAAQALFIEQGYENVTLEQVAAAAGLHVQTLYRHFPTKLDLAMAGVRVYVDRFERAIGAPDRKGDTLTFWRTWQTRTITRLTRGERAESYRRILTVEADTPGGAEVAAKVNRTYLDLLAASLRADLAEEDDKAGNAVLIAGMLLVGHGDVLRRYREERLAGDLLSEALATIDRVEALAAPYLRPTS